MNKKPQNIPAVPSVNYPDLATTFQAIRQNIALLWEELSNKASKTQAWEHTLIMNGSILDGTYYVIINSPKQIRITEVITRLAAGTCTLSPQINGIVMGGGTSAVTTSELTKQHIEKNILNEKGDLNFVISSASSSNRLTVTFRGTCEID